MYSTLAPPSGLSWLLGSADDLDAILRPALGPGPKSALASSNDGPLDLLSKLLGVPGDLDSLAKAALGEMDSDGSDSGPSDDPVESVLFTIRSDESDPSELRIVVEAVVVRDSSFDGKPTV